MRGDLGAAVDWTQYRAGTGGDHYKCIAAPIVPDGWRPTQPVAIWALDEGLHTGSVPFHRRSFELIRPGQEVDPHCREALERAERRSHLTSTAAPLLLLASNDVAYAEDQHHGAIIAPVVLSVLWLPVAPYVRHRMRKRRHR